MLNRRGCFRTRNKTYIFIYRSQNLINLANKAQPSANFISFQKNPTPKRTQLNLITIIICRFIFNF